MKRAFPHLLDYQNTAGGDTDAVRVGPRRPPTPFGAGSPMGNNPSTPPGMGKHWTPKQRKVGWIGTEIGGEDNSSQLTPGDDQIENFAAEVGMPPPSEPETPDVDFLQLVREAEAQSSRYMNQMNLRAWAQTMRAFHQQHYLGSKYTKPDFRNRSRFFRPKTRSAVRKDMAAVAASLFGNIDAINCIPGNEGDPQQRAAAAIMEELVNYRTDRGSGKAAIPWFMVAMGARQDSLLTGICISKQSWKIEYKKAEESDGTLALDEDSGAYVHQERWQATTDRPDIQLIPPENIIIDPAADWTNPIQSAQYVILKWPMTLEEVKTKQESPINPWNQVSPDMLRASTDVGTFNMSAIRRAREMDLDRMNEAQTGNQFQIVWVYEVFMRVGNTDYTFITVQDKAYLTDPRPVGEAYPEQGGERPLVMGFGTLEAHRIFPMSPAESWQMMQLELNDIVNLSLDAIKQNVMPVVKVQRGRNIDLDQIKRRSAGSSIVVSNKDDVTWERPPDVPQSVPMMTRELELEFDDLAGQFNGQTAENSNALSRTLGGLKLVAGSANAVQEYDIRVWIETWVAPVMSQVVKLEQYYESDEIVLGLCGERAQLFQKHGVSQIDDHLLEQEVTVRVSVGLGAGDPQQRLQKFAMATQIAMPLLQNSPKFKSGEWSINDEAVMQEIYGAAGYRDGGMRFISKNAGPQPNPMADLEQEKMRAETEKARAQGKASMLSGLAAVAKVALGNRELEADQANSMLDAQLRATDMGHGHGIAQNQQLLAAAQHGHEHGLAVAQQQQQAQQAQQQLAMQMQQQTADQQQQQASQPQPPTTTPPMQGGPAGGGQPPQGGPQPMQGGQPPMGGPPQGQGQPTRYEFVRGPDGRITGLVPVYADQNAPGLPPANLGGADRTPPSQHINAAG